MHPEYKGNVLSDEEDFGQKLPDDSDDEVQEDPHWGDVPEDAETIDDKDKKRLAAAAATATP